MRFQNPRKGISPLIAAVLLIAFTMAVAGIFSQWAPNLLQNIQVSTSEDAERTARAAQAGISIETIKKPPINLPIARLTFSNSGQIPLENFTVAVLYDDYDPEVLQIDRRLEPSEIHSYTLNLKSNAELVRINSEELPVQSQERDIDFGFYTPKENDFQSTPAKSFVRVLTSDRVINEYEPQGLTNLTEVGNSGDYSDLQTAIDNAENGETIIIEEGEYEWESVNVDKDVFIIGKGEVVLNGTNSASGVALVIGSEASPVIKNLEIWGYDSTGIDAGQTNGDWVVADLEISTGGSDILPIESTGDWMILDTTLDGDYAGAHYTNVNAPRVTGDALLERVHVRNGQYPINLNGANGSVKIRYSNIGGARGVYYENSVEKADTVVTIRDSYFTGNYNGAIHATDSAPEIDAKQNYWDSSDYDSVQSENVDPSDPIFPRNTEIHYLIPVKD